MAHCWLEAGKFQRGKLQVKYPDHPGAKEEVVSQFNKSLLPESQGGCGRTDGNASGFASGLNPAGSCPTCYQSSATGIRTE